MFLLEGWGREMGEEALSNYLQTKTVLASLNIS
jgi:hypothetical protein